MVTGHRWRVALSVAATLLALALSTGPALAADSDHHKAHDHTARRPLPEGVSPPSLTLEAKADAVGGYNLQIIAPGFVFSPERIDQESDAFEGHAHLYINGRKVGRLYGPWAHLPMSLFAPGDNEVRVSLNDNLHQAWTHADQPIEARIVLEGPQAWSGREVVLDLAKHDSDQPIAIARGEAIRLIVSSPKAIVLHLHGYDLVADAGPHAPAVFTFEAEHSGRFALVTHGEEDVLGREEVPVAYLEIRRE